MMANTPDDDGDSAVRLKQIYVPNEIILLLQRCGK